MPTFDSNNTRRWFLDYNDGQHDHTMLIRSSNSAGAGDFNSMFTVWADAWDPVSYEITVLGLRMAAALSHIALPQTYTGPATFGTGAMPANRAPLQTCFVGRDSDGVRFRMFIFGINVTVPDNFRYDRGTGTALDDTLGVMEEFDQFFWTVNGKAPTFNPYADANYNSYWERQVRG